MSRLTARRTDRREPQVIIPKREVMHICDWIKRYFVENGDENTKAVIGISGGKDSTVAAGLLAQALGANRVIGVLMPEGEQRDIEDARKVCELLNIRSYEINIGEACNSLYHAIDVGYDYNKNINKNPAVSTNTPSRIRMATLYAIAAEIGGRVCNTCNYSEDYVGYSTKYGDAAGDFALLKHYTVREVLQIGKELLVPEFLLKKIPEDGMSGMSDEEKLGFTYEELDAYLLDGVVPSAETLFKIESLHAKGRHKEFYIPTVRPLTRHYISDKWTENGIRFA